MTASDLAILAFASCFGVGCAQGYDVGVSSMSEASTMVPTAGLGGMGGSGGAGGDPSASGAGAVGGAGGMGGMSAAPGEACTRNDMAPCACEGSDAQGRRICLFDAASPTQGFFSECMGCPAPMPAASCSDGMQNGAETSADCGGPDCPPCALGAACVADSDCAAGMCIASACTAPQPAGTGGDSGSGGSGGSSGEGGSEAGSGGEPPIDEPVEDCDGVPEGTECDRDCILPGNTATCNSRGDCSCL